MIQNYNKKHSGKTTRYYQMGSRKRHRIYYNETRINLFFT